MIRWSFSAKLWRAGRIKVTAFKWRGWPEGYYDTEGHSLEKFVNEMWAQYRTAPGMPPTDGWKQPHDESYLKNAIEKAAEKPKK